jgi:hypothetical protein
VSLAGFRVVGFVGARGVAHSIHKLIIKKNRHPDWSHLRHPDSPRIGTDHKGGLGITPLQASGLAAFYSATVVDAKAQLMEMVRNRTPIDRFADQRSPMDGTGVRVQERVYHMRFAPLSGPPSFWIP